MFPRKSFLSPIFCHCSPKVTFFAGDFHILLLVFAFFSKVSQWFNCSTYIQFLTARSSYLLQSSTESPDKDQKIWPLQKNRGFCYPVWGPTHHPNHTGANIFAPSLVISNLDHEKYYPIKPCKLCTIAAHLPCTKVSI